jgi:hypothetical protein
LSVLFWHFGIRRFFFLHVLFGTRWVLGVSCRVWCVLFACSCRALRDLRAPAVGYCLFF